MNKLTKTLAFAGVLASTTAAYATQPLAGQNPTGAHFKILDCYCGKTATGGLDTLHMDIVIVRKYGWDPVSGACQSAQVIYSQRVDYTSLSDHGGEGHQGIPGQVDIALPAPPPRGVSAVDYTYVLVSSTPEPRTDWIGVVLNSVFSAAQLTGIPFVQAAGAVGELALQYLDSQEPTNGQTYRAGSIFCGLYYHPDGTTNWFYEKALGPDGNETQEAYASNLWAITTPVPPHIDPAVCFHLRPADPNTGPQYIMEAEFVDCGGGAIPH